MSEFIPDELHSLFESLGVKVPTPDQFWADTNTDLDEFLDNIRQRLDANPSATSDPATNLRGIAGYLFGELSGPMEAARLCLLLANAGLRLTGANR
jgi:hypothetical protein